MQAGEGWKELVGSEIKQHENETEIPRNQGNSRAIANDLPWEDF